MIELQGFRAGYPGVEVLHGLDLAIPRGEVTVVAGPNGCGKSTLLKALIGAARITGGQALLNGRPLSSYRPDELARTVALLPQSKAVPDITVQRLVLHGRFPYLRYPRRYTAADRTAAEAAMARMGILDLAERPMRELSGGMRQKAYIAMLLAQNTPAVLMDEPTTWLDPARQLQLLDLSRALAAEGRAVVLVLHDLPLAMSAADKLVLLDEGRVADCGAPEAVYDRGSVQRVLEVPLRRFATEEGFQYYFERKQGGGMQL